MNSKQSDLNRKIPALGEILDKVVRPFLCGAALRGPFTDRFISSEPVSYDTEHRLKIRVTPDSKEYFSLQRPLPFSAEEKDFAGEIVGRIHKDNIASEENSLEKARVLAEKVIAGHISRSHADTVFRALQVHAQWSENSKEPLNHTIGIYLNKQRKSGDDFFSLKDERFMKTLGSAPDTLLALGPCGKILGVEKLPSASAARVAEKDILSPARWADLALWSNTRHRVAIRLTESGEMFIFRNGKMALFKRDCVWRRPPHRLVLENIISEELSSLAKEVIKAVYLTALDMAFEGQRPTVGGILKTSNPDTLNASISAESLIASENPGNIARLAADIINNRQFQSLPRSIRRQLCSFEGALVLDQVGNILTVGASVGICEEQKDRYSESETAKAIGRNGMGFCVSPRGGIEIYRGNYPPLVLA